MNQKLFAVYLGGRVPKCSIELHDVAFVIGTSIEATYQQMMDKWFGDPRHLHVDSWVELQIVDGHRIVLQRTPADQPRKLYFINLGAYQPGQFTELHANAFLVAESEPAVKQRAKRELLQGTQSLHTDDLYEVDDCLEIARVEGFYIRLEPTAETQPFAPNNGYHVIPPEVVRAYIAQRRLPAD